ncbi:MAG: RsmD family RNA methyltransferase [Oscillospiraceae bacterium]|nr:RsmD family RNA methyltransferase [Oscillospiraceae bacterium]
MPRIIAGCYGGLPLKTPGGRQTRPTADRVKEAMFSAITARLDLEGTTVLELFAGSGQLGLEALSRGAARVTWVDKDPAAQRAIRENLQKVGRLTDPALQLLSCSAEAAYRLLTQPGSPRFDLILADPPYQQAEAFFAAWQARACWQRLLKPAGLLVFEEPSPAERRRIRPAVAKASPARLPGRPVALTAAVPGANPVPVTKLKLSERCQYGAAMVSFYKPMPGFAEGPDPERNSAETGADCSQIGEA